jgi:hypothetical protein
MFSTETATYESAGALLEAFRSELDRGRFHDQAEALRGIEVLGPTDAETALLVLQCMEPMNREIDLVKRHIEGHLSMLKHSAKRAAA